MSSLVYTVKASKLDLKITLVETTKLYIHEEIIPKILSWLVEKIRNDGVWTDPVIVDEKTMIVLDGVHRVAAAEELGLKYIPVCLVDYDNPSIELHTWSRVFKPVRRESGVTVDYLEALLRALNASSYRSVHVSSLDVGFKMLSRRDLLGIVVYGKRVVGIKTPIRDIKTIYDHIKRIENIAVNKGFTIEYHTEQDALSLAKLSENVALIPPVIRKEEVKAVTMRGEVFAHKATRHVIPARPLRVNVPLKWLTGEISLEITQRELLKHLSERKVKILPPGTVLDRKYEEELYVFE